MPDHSFVIVAVLAFLAPLTRELIPQLFVPAIVLELVFGILVGPQVLGIAEVSSSVRLFADVGLAALLYLAGREIQVDRLRGRPLERALASFAISFLIAAGIAALLHTTGLVKTPLLVATVLVATSLSVIIVPLRDAGETGSEFGQQVIVTSAIAEFGAIILLSFFFSAERAGPGTELVHLSAFVLLAVIVFIGLSESKRVERLIQAFDRLQEGSAQIRVRADLALIAVVVALAVQLGLEAILAAFTVGVIRGMTTPKDESGEVVEDVKLDAIALGIFVPFFFISSGINFQLDELFGSVSAVLRLPIFVLAIAVVHLLPARLYVGSMGQRRAMAAGFLQATSFSFIIVATEVGVRLGIMVPATATALVGAGLITVVAFPAVAFSLLGDDHRITERDADDTFA